MYEWQVYKGNSWTGNIWNFPPSFRKLPIVQPKQGQSLEDARSRQLFPESPPKQTVLTDAAVTKVFKMDKGYSLPESGGIWEWVSGWRVDKHVSSDESSQRRRVDCDEEGWSYAQAVEHFITSPADLCFDNEHSSNDAAPRHFRRRRWSRQRALKSYPNASNSTLHFLRILAENARLSIMVTKLTDQLVATKSKLTETEDLFAKCKEKQVLEMESLKREKKHLEETINRMPRERSGSGEITNLSKPRSPDLRLDQHIDMVRNVAGGFANSLVSTASNAASNAFRKTPQQDHKHAILQDQMEELSSIADGNQKKPSTDNAPFDWRRLGRSMTQKNKDPVQDVSASKNDVRVNENDHASTGEIMNNMQGSIIETTDNGIPSK